MFFQMSNGEPAWIATYKTGGIFMKSKIKNVLLPLSLMLLALTACSESSATSSRNSTDNTSSESSARSSQKSTDNTSEAYSIGVIQLVEHPSLNASYEGFVQALADNGYEEGELVSYDFQNAQGDTNNLSTISDRFVSNNVDMVLAISTPATQAIAGKTTTIPIIATAVTSYTESGLIDSNEAPGGNISGTSDMNPIAAQIELGIELFPETETVGIIYNSSETNSVLQASIAKQEIERLGLNYSESTVTNSNDVYQAMESLVTKSDLIYIPTDNVLAATMPTVGEIAAAAKIPVICGSTDMVKSGGLLTMGIDYYQLGYQTGSMALSVIDGADIGDMPIQFAQNSDEIIINGVMAEAIGYSVPEEYQYAVVMP